MAGKVIEEHPSFYVTVLSANYRRHESTALAQKPEKNERIGNSMWYSAVTHPGRSVIFMAFKGPSVAWL